MVEPCMRDVSPEPLSDTLAFLADHAAQAGYMDLADWANAERKGYGGEPPVYRHVTGTTVGYRPNDGWRPVRPPVVGLRSSTLGLKQSITHIEHAIANAQARVAYVHLGAEELTAMNAGRRARFAQIAVATDVGALHNIMRAVRSLSTKWAADVRGHIAAVPSRAPGAHT